MLIGKLKAVINKRGLFYHGDRILVGVSGGVDSLALLQTLHELSESEGWFIIAAHLNHQFRGEEAKQDADYVAQFCTERSIPFEIGSRDVPRMIALTGENLQATARKARFDFFYEVAGKWSIEKIALAHHANDQAETVLMRMLRGTGVEGLAGIPWIREEQGLLIIRPFLSFYKKELEDYCHEKKIVSRQDLSNLSTKYHRNFLRLKIIPQLETEVNPKLQQSLVQLSEIAQTENDLLDKMSKNSLKKLMKWKEDNKIVIKGKLFLNCHPALQRRMIKLIFNYLHAKQQNIGYLHIEQVNQWIQYGQQASTIELPEGIHAWKEYDLIIFSNKESRNADHFNYHLALPGNTYILEINATITASLQDSLAVPPIDKPANYALFDWEQVRGSLTVRSRSSGERMTLLGTSGSKKIKDIFIDAKIPRRFRDGVPIVADEDNILWIPGVKRSGVALVTPNTKKLLVLYIDRLWFEESGGTDE